MRRTDRENVPVVAGGKSESKQGRVTLAVSWLYLLTSTGQWEVFVMLASRNDTAPGHP